MISVQRKIGLLFVGAGVVVVGINIGAVMTVHNLRGFDILLRPTVGPVAAIVAIVGVLSFIDTNWARGAQVVLTWAFAVPSFMDRYDAFFGPAFVVMGVVLAYTYGWFRRHFWLKGGLVAAYTFGMMFLGASGSEASELVSALNGILFLLFFLVFVWIVYSKEIRAYIDAEKQARDELDENQSWIEHGRNAGYIAHNFKGKLSVIDGYLELLSMAATSGEKTHIEVARRAVTELDHMTKLMVYAGKARHQNEVSIVPVSTLLEAIVQQYTVDKENAHRVQVTLEECPDAQISAAPADLMQIFDNLVRNAFEAIEERGRLTVAVRMMRELVEITIEDDGVGLATCEQRSAGPGQCGDCTSCDLFREGKTTKPQGSGFGMVYVQRTLRKYGATMRIYSKVGSGTKIVILFPSKMAHDEDNSVLGGRRHGNSQARGKVLAE